MEKPAETSYRAPEFRESVRREEERRLVREGAQLSKFRQEELLREKQREQTQLRHMLANYWPWGRPGAGAPCAAALRKKNVPLEPLEKVHRRRSSSSDLLPQIQNGSSNDYQTRSQVHRDIYNCYDDEQPRAAAAAATTAAAAAVVAAEDPAEEQERERARIYRVIEDVELAPLLRRGYGSYDFRDIPLEQRQQQQQRRQRQQTQSTRHVATDATRPGYMIDSWRASNAHNKDHLNELAAQIREKQVMAQEERRWEEESCRRHFDTWQGLWGRGGHGAPIDHARRRNNLHDILYRTAASPSHAGPSLLLHPTSPALGPSIFHSAALP